MYVYTFRLLVRHARSLSIQTVHYGIDSTNPPQTHVHKLKIRSFSTRRSQKTILISKATEHVFYANEH